MDVASDRRRPAHGWGENAGLADLLGPLTPELALVSEELAAVARALLPEDPWKALLSSATPDLDWASVDRLRAPLSRERPGVQARARASRNRFSVGRLVSALGLLAVGGVLLVGSLPIVVDAPTLGSVAHLSQAPPVGAPAAGPRAHALTPGPVPGSGYVGTVVRIAVADDGNALRWILAVTGCSPTIALTQTFLRSDATFGARGALGKTVAVVVGRFVSDRLARGELRISGGRCSPHRVPFVARLS